MHHLVFWLAWRRMPTLTLQEVNRAPEAVQVVEGDGPLLGIGTHPHALGADHHHATWPSREAVNRSAFSRPSSASWMRQMDSGPGGEGAAHHPGCPPGSLPLWRDSDGRLVALYTSWLTGGGWRGRGAPSPWTLTVPMGRGCRGVVCGNPTRRPHYGTLWPNQRPSAGGGCDGGSSGTRVARTRYQRTRHR